MKPRVRGEEGELPKLRKAWKISQGNDVVLSPLMMSMFFPDSKKNGIPDCGLMDLPRIESEGNVPFFQPQEQLGQEQDMG